MTVLLYFVLLFRDFFSSDCFEIHLRRALLSLAHTVSMRLPISSVLTACSMASTITPACRAAANGVRMMSADVPSIVVGGGRIGAHRGFSTAHPRSLARACHIPLSRGVRSSHIFAGSLLADLGVDGDVVLKRGDPFPESPTSGPIYVTTRNDDLAGVIETTPASRRKDLVFMQNGMLGAFLEGQGLADNTQVLLYLAVAKLGEPPIDGITEFNPEGLTAATGKWSEAFAARLAKGDLRCRALSGADYTAAMLEKHVWICAFMMTGALNGGVTVGDVESKHADQLRALVSELCAAGEQALGVKLPEGAYDRLAAYGRSVAHFPTAVKEFEWRACAAPSLRAHAHAPCEATS